MGQRHRPSSSNDSDPLIGETFAGRYVIERRLGQGGMAVVYAAHDKNLKRDVAVKILRQDAVDSRRAAQRLKREARAVGRLHHRHIIAFHDVGMTAGRVFIVMERLRGHTLAQERLRLGRLPFRRACVLCAQVASALRVVHGAGIVHRDLKPENIYLVQRHGGDFCKLLDFSIAKLPTTMVDGQITVTGTVFGTPHYMSPEQAMGDPVSPATDIYALGAILFELITGRTPFVANNPVELVTQQGLRPAPRVRDLHPMLPQALDDLVASMLEKSPRDRPASAGDTEKAMTALSKLKADDAPPDAGEIPPPPPRREASGATSRGNAAARTAALVTSPSAVFAAVSKDLPPRGERPPVKPPPRPVAPDPADPYERETQPAPIRHIKPFGRTQPATARAMRGPLVAPEGAGAPDDLPPTDHGLEEVRGRPRVQTRRPITGGARPPVVTGAAQVAPAGEAGRVTEPHATPTGGQKRRETVPTWKGHSGRVQALDDKDADELDPEDDTI